MRPAAVSSDQIKERSFCSTTHSAVHEILKLPRIVVSQWHHNLRVMVRLFQLYKVLCGRFAKSVLGILIVYK